MRRCPVAVWEAWEAWTTKGETFTRTLRWPPWETVGGPILSSNRASQLTAVGNGSFHCYLLSGKVPSLNTAGGFGDSTAFSLGKLAARLEAERVYAQPCKSDYEHDSPPRSGRGYI
jgi:hypothetical protein